MSKNNMNMVELNERMKELNCMFQFSELINKTDISLEEIYQGLVDIIPSAWRYPEITVARVNISDQIFKTKDFRETKWRQASEITLGSNVIGTLEVFYLIEKSIIDEGPFLKEERNLIDSLAERLGKVIQRYSLFKELNKSKDLLEYKNNSLEAKNIALSELFKQVEKEKIKLEENIISNIELTIFPLIGILNKTEENNIIFSLLYKELNELTSDYSTRTRFDFSHLSSREIEICNLIRNGCTSKKMAELLSISDQTVNKHRFNIRKKLKLTNKGANLESYLKSLKQK